MLGSDAIVHELYGTATVREAVAARIGPGVVAADGSIDRRALARRVFADEDERRWLEALIHPLVAARAARWRERERARTPPPRALVQEVALLFEADLERRYDRTLLVTASPAHRAARLAARGGMAAIEERERLLLPEAEKRRRADDVLANDGDLAALDEAVARYLDAFGA